MKDKPAHIPVLFKEVLTGLRPRPGGRYIDGTVGAGGHARGILEASGPDGLLLGIDADPAAIGLARERLAGFGPRLTLVEGNFADLEDIATRHGFRPADGLLLDLGLSSMQLENGARGFSFQKPGPLDMRFGEQGPTAAELVNTLSQEELRDLLRRYGQERYAGRIARAIVTRRPLTTTTELAEVVAKAVGRRGRIHPATRTFQALRIAVNDELAALSAALSAALNILAPGGRLAVITFHSLEDRLVKTFYRDHSRACICPPQFPICTCGGQQATLQILTKKPLRPSVEELKTNRRSRSARLRLAVHL